MTYGGMPHVLYVGRDISERKRAEERLRTSEEQYRAIFNAAADALVLRDAEFRIVDVNPAYESLSGYSRDEVVGLDRVVANPPEIERQMKELHRGALAGEPVVVETVRVRKDGAWREVELRGVPIQYRGAPHVLYIGRDITRAQARRAGAAPGAADGSDRPPDRGHGARFQQPARQRSWATSCSPPSATAPRGDPKLASYLDQAQASCRRARDLIQQMLTFSRGQRGPPRPVALAAPRARVGQALALVACLLR